MKKKKKEFLIACDWQESGVIHIEAYTLKEAIKKVEDGADPLPDADYVDDSFQVNKEVTELLNSKEYKLSK